MANTQSPDAKLPISTLDVEDLFKSDDKSEVKDDKNDIPDDVDNTDDKEDEKDDKEDEIDLVEPEDEDTEKLDLKSDDNIDISGPPRKKEILKKFPELFKEFPFLEKILYRDKEYNELFGSFDDAKEIAAKAEVFNEFETQLLSGNTEEVLKNVKEADPKAFDKIVDNYLLSLHKVDKEAYFDVINNINKRLIVEMVNEANSSSNEDLKQAALMVNQFLFGTSKFTPSKNRVEENPDEKKDEVEQERLSFIQERFESSRDELQSKVDNTLRATINEYIDPNGRMSAYVKKNAIADTLKFLNESISSDSAMKGTLDKLWRSAFASKFSRDSLSKIQSFYLGKAKNHLPNALKKAKTEALKDNTSPRREKDNSEDKEETTSRRLGPIKTGSPSSQTNKGGMKKGESVTDFFARD